MWNNLSKGLKKEIRIIHIPIDWFKVNKQSCIVLLEGGGIGYVANGYNSIEQKVLQNSNIYITWYFMIFVRSQYWEIPSCQALNYPFVDANTCCCVQILGGTRSNNSSFSTDLILVVSPESSDLLTFVDDFDRQILHPNTCLVFLKSACLFWFPGWISQLVLWDKPSRWFILCNKPSGTMLWKGVLYFLSFPFLYLYYLFHFMFPRFCETNHLAHHITPFFFFLNGFYAFGQSTCHTVWILMKNLQAWGMTVWTRTKVLDSWAKYHQDSSSVINISLANQMIFMELSIMYLFLPLYNVITSSTSSLFLPFLSIS